LKIEFKLLVCAIVSEKSSYNSDPLVVVIFGKLKDSFVSQIRDLSEKKVLTSTILLKSFSKSL
jgi:hypothetical protein